VTTTATAPRSREVARSRIQALDAEVLRARRRGDDVEADRLTRERDELARRWARQLEEVGR